MKKDGKLPALERGEGSKGELLAAGGDVGSASSGCARMEGFVVTASSKAASTALACSSSKGSLASMTAAGRTCSRVGVGGSSLTTCSTSSGRCSSLFAISTFRCPPPAATTMCAGTSTVGAPPGGTGASRLGLKALSNLTTGRSGPSPCFSTGGASALAEKR